MFTKFLLFAQQETVEKSVEWAKMPTNPLQWFLLISVVLAVFAFIVYTYRRDASELPGFVGVILGTLRILAFVGLFIVWLEPRWRVEVKLRQDSVVAVASDVSLSMSIRDTTLSGIGTGPTRADKVIETLSTTKLIQDLRERHDVLITSFGSEDHTIARLKRIMPGEKEVQPSGGTNTSGNQANQDNEKQIALKDIEWVDVLKPVAAETRMGQSLRRILTEESASTLVGIVVFSDGQQNSGIDPEVAVRLAQESKTKICTVGLGSDRSPINVRIGDVIAPARTFPGDEYTVSAYVQGQDLAGELVTVELLSRPAGGDETEEVSEGTRQVTLGDKGQAQAATFTVKAEIPGRRTLKLRVLPVQGDINPRDDMQEVDVEIVERKTRVLLFASGPTREYRFLRNQLHRDPEVTVDVLLQTARPGISQDAAEILETFPMTSAEMAEYDAVIAFDPNWMELTETQIDVLEKWVAEQSGGLVVVAGPVWTESWVGESQVEKIRSLYPIKFSRHHALLDAGRFTNREPSPITMTRDGVESQFLWIEDDPVDSRRAWDDFEGVYGFYAVKEEKPGATVYARYTDPNSISLEKQPIYFAGQFYGSGRVFYMGSGEMWRTRAMNEAFFERFYTKLIRHVSEGRLLRGSKRGVLLVERDRYLIGQTVAIRAQLSNAELQPLEATSVTLDVIPPEGPPIQITMKADKAGRKGMFNGQFLATQEGAYRLELEVPDSTEERLTRRIQVKISDRERENPQLNEAKLKELANRTGGKYLKGTNQAADLVKLLPSKPTIRYRLDKPESVWDKWKDPWFEASGRVWMMSLICGLLFFEWLIRRLSRLA